MIVVKKLVILKRLLNAVDTTAYPTIAINYDRKLST